ncbi:hypothetical protein [Chryseobacterium arachidis]|uniref:hypothetical protein n=1 Tax=Chryseobacterium arachidis TaxID=1416778 RepID=UPI0011606599|nr:hypothetical protein [Chryseobacterium arachidis]
MSLFINKTKQEATTTSFFYFKLKLRSDFPLSLLAFSGLGSAAKPPNLILKRTQHAAQSGLLTTSCKKTL